MNEIFTILQPWYPAIGASCFILLIRYLYKNFLINLMRQLSDKASFKAGEEILNAFEHPINVLLAVINVYVAVNLAPIPALQQAAFIDKILRSTIVLSFFWGCYNITDTTHGFMLRMLEKAGVKAEDALSNIFSTILHIIVVVLGFVAIAKEWNYDISGFVASLGIGSLAVAFAAKDSLANVFGSLVIILDKPFKVGDWITANGVEGVVEEISFRSTCVRTFPQELVYIPNSLLTNTPITNFTARQKRRIDFVLGLTYSSTKEQIEDFISRLKNFLSNHPDIYHDDIRVHFINYGASSLDIRVTCYAMTSDSVKYLDISQDINLKVLGLLEEAGVGCAFPSTSVYFETPLPINEVAKTAGPDTTK